MFTSINWAFSYRYALPFVECQTLFLKERGFVNHLNSIFLIRNTTKMAREMRKPTGSTVIENCFEIRAQKVRSVACLPPCCITRLRAEGRYCCSHKKCIVFLFVFWTVVRSVNNQRLLLHSYAV